MRTILTCFAILCAGLAAVSAGEPAAQSAGDRAAGMQNPLGGDTPMTPEELVAQKVEVAGKANRMIESFVGTYRAEAAIDGVQSIIELAIQPKFVNGQYFPGSYSVKPVAGGAGYEAFNIFCFNGGAMSYLFFYFGSDGFIRNYIGIYSDNEIVIRSPFPSGMEYIRWRKEADGALKQERWKPSKNNMTLPETEADEIILFKKLQ